MPQNLKDLLDKIQSSKNILILPDSGRLDHDCICSSLALHEWIKLNFNKNPEIYIFNKLPSRLENLNRIQNIKNKFHQDVNFYQFDLIFLIDNFKWDRFFGKNYDDILSPEIKSNCYQIDHHIKSEITFEINDRAFIKEDSSTSKVLFDLVLEPSNKEINQSIATNLYLALMSDTQVFKVAANKEAFEFASKMIGLGVDHQKAVEALITFSKDEFDALNLAIEKTSFHSDISTTTLIISDELREVIDKPGETDDLLELYREIFMRRVEGYHYSITFKWSFRMEKTKVSWRVTESKAQDLLVLKVLQEMNFVGGGHPGSGGGYLDMKPEEAESKFLETMRLHVQP